jgi:hypothetical protein
MVTAAPDGQTSRPTAGLIASLAVWHWIAPTPAGPVAFLLLAHPPKGHAGSPAEIALRMRGLADSLRLAVCSKPLPDIGPRLLLHDLDALLKLDRCDYLLHAPVGDRWSEFAAAGGTVTIVVGLDPLRPHAPKELVEAYMAATARTGRLFMGKTHLIPIAGPDRPTSAAGWEGLR